MYVVWLLNDAPSVGRPIHLAEFEQSFNIITLVKENALDYFVDSRSKLNISKKQNHIHFNLARSIGRYMLGVLEHFLVFAIQPCLKSTFPLLIFNDIAY